MLTDIKKRLQTYTGSELQHFNHILNYFEAIGSDFPTARKIVQSVIAVKMTEVRTFKGKRLQRQRVEKTAAVNNPGLQRCSVCGGPVHISAVNDSPRTNIGGDYHSVIECLVHGCLHQEYSPMFVEEYK